MAEIGRDGESTDADAALRMHSACRVRSSDAHLPRYSPWNSDSGSRLSFARLEPDPNGPQNAHYDIVRESDEAFQNSRNRDEITKFLAGVH